MTQGVGEDLLGHCCEMAPAALIVTTFKERQVKLLERDLEVQKSLNNKLLENVCEQQVEILKLKVSAGEFPRAILGGGGSGSTTPTHPQPRTAGNTPGQEGRAGGGGLTPPSLASTAPSTTANNSRQQQQQRRLRRPPLIYRQLSPHSEGERERVDKDDTVERSELEVAYQDLQEEFKKLHMVVRKQSNLLRAFLRPKSPLTLPQADDSLLMTVESLSTLGLKRPPADMEYLENLISEDDDLTGRRGEGRAHEEDPSWSHAVAPTVLARWQQRLVSCRCPPRSEVAAARAVGGGPPRGGHRKHRTAIVAVGGTGGKGCGSLRWPSRKSLEWGALLALLVEERGAHLDEMVVVVITEPRPPPRR
ncbi:unnamed protein product [Lampetra planeri]